MKALRLILPFIIVVSACKPTYVLGYKGLSGTLLYIEYSLPKIKKGNCRCVWLVKGDTLKTGWEHGPVHYIPGNCYVLR